MDINSLTIGEARELGKMFGGWSDQAHYIKDNDAHWKIGKNYLIRTVTMVDTGKLVSVTDKELVLVDAAWIADTGRFSDALKSCKFNEVEPFPDGEVIIGRGSIIEAVQVESVQRSQK